MCLLNMVYYSSRHIRQVILSYTSYSGGESFSIIEQQLETKALVKVSLNTMQDALVLTAGLGSSFVMEGALLRAPSWEHPRAKGPIAQMRGGMKTPGELASFVYRVKNSKKSIFI